MHFGITDSTGAPKPPLLELARFASDLAAVDVASVTRAPVDAALVVPSHLAADYPFTQEAERALIVAAGEQAYVAAHEAHVPVAVVREAEGGGIPAGYGLYLLPSVKQLCGPTWLQLRSLASAGATVYASYCAGDVGVQRGPWWAYTEELFGVQRESAYGLVSPVLDEEVVVRFVAPFGSLDVSSELRFTVAGNEHSRSFLPVTVTSGTVIAVDAHDRPVIVSQSHGAGRAVLSTYPFEYFASALSRVNPEETWRLYDALAVVADVERDVVVDDPLVFTDSLVHVDGRRFVFFVSQHPSPVTVTPAIAGVLQTLAGDAVSSVSLDGYGVEVRELVYE
jgi:beta-glucosidase